MVSPAKKLKSVVRPFISAVAASTASRRGLAAAQAPSFIPKSAASSKSKQSAAKLLTAKYRNFFEPDAEPHETTNETVARLKELAEEQNCWVAELLLDLCPLEPDADPMLLDAFSLANIKSGSCFYFPSKHKPSDGKAGWSELYRDTQRRGYLSGSQLVCHQTAGRTGDRNVLGCYRSKLHDPTTSLPLLSTNTAKFAICWYHRGRQKTIAFKSLADAPAAKDAFEDFNIMCEAMSDDVESEEEYELVLELTRMMVEKMHKEGTFSTGLVSKINKQLEAIDGNKKHIANHYFREIFHLFKRTTTANEVRHRNIKYGEDRVTPSSSLL